MPPSSYLAKGAGIGALRLVPWLSTHPARPGRVETFRWAIQLGWYNVPGRVLQDLTKEGLRRGWIH